MPKAHDVRHAESSICQAQRGSDSFNLSFKILYKSLLLGSLCNFTDYLADKADQHVHQSERGQESIEEKCDVVHGSCGKHLIHELRLETAQDLRQQELHCPRYIAEYIHLCKNY